MFPRFCARGRQGLHKNNYALYDGFALFLLTERGLAKATIETYLQECAQFDVYLQHNDYDLFDVTTQHIIEYIHTRQQDNQQDNERPLHYRTVAKILSTLRTLFGYLLRNSYVHENPVGAITNPKSSLTLPKVLDIEIVDRILNTIEVETPLGLRDRALFETIYSCGLRVSEVIAIRKHTLFLEQQLIHVVGKGDRERVVPLGEEAIYWIRRYATNALPLLDRHSCPFLFLTRHGTRLSRKSVWKRFHQIVARSGVKASVHTLRHSFATHLLSGGAGLRIVQEMLGHRNLATTQIYTHLNKKELHAYHTQYHPRSGL